MVRSTASLSFLRSSRFRIALTMLADGVMVSTGVDGVRLSPPEDEEEEETVGRLIVPMDIPCGPVDGAGADKFRSASSLPCRDSLSDADPPEWTDDDRAFSFLGAIIERVCLVSGWVGGARRGKGGSDGG